MGYTQMPRQQPQPMFYGHPSAAAAGMQQLPPQPQQGITGSVLQMPQSWGQMMYAQRPQMPQQLNTMPNQTWNFGDAWRQLANAFRQGGAMNDGGVSGQVSMDNY